MLFEASAIVGAAFYHPATASFGADYVHKWVYRLDPTTGKANAFAKVSAFPTGLLVGPDGALYVLNGTAIDRVTR